MRALADVLELKADLGIKTRALYRAGDKAGLKELTEEYALAVKRVKAFYKLFETQWLKENKPFGFEIQDLRIGGLIQRIESCRRRILGYCAGKTAKIPELDADILPFGELSKEFTFNHHLSSVSVSVP